MLKKAKWKDDCLSPILLGIDDLCDGYFKKEHQKISPFFDAGYGTTNDGSIFSYLNKNLLQKYPEIKITFFLPFGKGAYWDKDKSIINNIFERAEFEKFLNFILDCGYEIAYHGHDHGLINSTLDPSTWCCEFDQYSKEEYFDIIKSDLAKFKDRFGYEVYGGRSPGYKFKDDLIDGLCECGFKWWSFDYKPFINNINLKYNGCNIIEMPSNLSGDMFNYSKNPIKSAVKYFLNLYRLEYMIKNNQTASIAEHFFRTRFDGKIQMPNIYNDINSLDFLFGYLRNKNVWYATFSECASYYESYKNTDILDMGDGVFEIEYKGDWKMFLTFISEHRYLENIQTKEIYEGFMKSGRWLFNDLVEGTYRGHKDVF